MFDDCNNCKKYGENTCGNDPECRCFEPMPSFSLWPCSVCKAQSPDCDTDKQHFPCFVED